MLAKPLLQATEIEQAKVGMEEKRVGMEMEENARKKECRNRTQKG